MYYGMNNTIIEKNRNKQKTKLQVFNAVMVPIISYGVESLAIYEKHFSKITAVEIRYKRRMVGENRRDRIRNERIREVG